MHPPWRASGFLLRGRAPPSAPPPSNRSDIAAAPLVRRQSAAPRSAPRAAGGGSAPKLRPARVKSSGEAERAAAEPRGDGAAPRRPRRRDWLGGRPHGQRRGKNQHAKWKENQNCSFSRKALAFSSFHMFSFCFVMEGAGFSESLRQNLGIIG